jgi:hypothetical protein
LWGAHQNFFKKSAEKTFFCQDNMVHLLYHQNNYKMAKLITTKQPTKTPIQLGSRVTFEGNLPGGYYDNYSGYSKRGAIYGTVTGGPAINRKNGIHVIVETKDGSQYNVRLNELTNMEDLF